MRVDQFDFDLPEERIALRPAVPRDSARMLVVQADGSLTHAHVRDLPGFLERGDAMVLNDTRVFPARLRGTRTRETTAKIEITLHKRLGPDRFAAFAKPARKLDAGDTVALGRLTAKVLRRDAAEVELEFALSGAALDAAIAAEGEVPLPPYIAGKRKPDARDTADYQTIYAKDTGSVAAPTAGLHFTPELFTALDARGVTRETVTLHVGAGTFLPVTADDTAGHKMHAEWASLDAATASRLKAARRIVAVGTTSLRTLEASRLEPFEGETDIFITPGYRFQTAQVLLTNFHLPRSTLFMLVSAFAGLDVMRAAYAAAIREGYRFYSYGDACLLFRQPC